jgi:putative ABC transport system permease protein
VTAPRIARLLLRLLLPARDRGVIIGDLDEELRRDVAPGRGAGAARLWYWGQVLSTMPYALRQRLVPALAHLPGDARYALRLWRRQPAFAAAAIVTQAIGIAVATAVLAVAYAVLVRPLPYADAHRIVRISELPGRPGLFSYQDFVDLRRANRSFDAVAGFSGGSRTLAFPGQAPERLPAFEVSDSFFEVLGVQPTLGRTITSGDTARTAEPVVILSHPFWTRRFGGDPAAVGRTLPLNGRPHTIVGVLPGDFAFPLRGLADLWVPMRPSAQQEERGYWHWMDVIGLRTASVTPAQADADLQSIARQFAARDARWHADAQLGAEPLRDVIVGGVRPTIQALLAAVGLVLLATCATIAGLLLSRGATRARELSVRAAIGAGRGRLVAQLLTENVLLSFAGGGAGILAGHWLLQAFVNTVPAGRRGTLPHFDDLGVGLPIAAAALALSVATGLVFGVLPAWRASRGDGSAALRTMRVTEGRQAGRLRFALVGLQMAVALVLLSGAALLGTSVYRLLRVAPGFDPVGLVTMRINLPGTYRETDAINLFHARVRERLEAIPGVTAVAAVNQAPLTGQGDTGSLTVIERPRGAGVQGPDVSLRTVSANYFPAMGVPIVRGRGFTEADQPGAPLVVVVNRWLAERLLPGADPIGQHLTFAFAPGPFQIVGIVGDEQLDDVDRPLLPAVYFPARQDGLSSATLMVRTTQPDALLPAARAALAASDPHVPIFAVRTIEQITDGSAAVFMRRAAMWMLGIFAVAAILLAAMGLYGVLAQAVAERTREIGVRVALGATRGRIFRLVLRRGLGAAAVGVALGVGGTALASRLLAALLFGVRPAEPVVVAACAAFLAAVATVACLVPALRAVRIDPASAVRDA